MKKIFTLLTVLLLAVAVMAADRRPMVSVNSMKNYKIVIDGKSFFTRDNNTIQIANMHGGRHSIQVYEMRRGYNDRRERLVASSSFHLNSKDVRILVDRFGNISIRESKRNGRFDRDDRRSDDRDWNDRNDRDNRDWNDRNWNDRDERDHRDDRKDRNARF